METVSINPYLLAMTTSPVSPQAVETPSSAPLKIGEQHPQLFAVIRDKLRERILSGEFTPGDRLVEGRLSEEMGVSRIPVREALRALAAEGLVTIEPRRGASVSVLSDAVAYDMVEVRATLEGLNAKLAAQRRDAKTVERLQAFLRDRTALLFAPSNMHRAKANWDEHSQILNAVIAGNGDLAALLASQHVHNAAKAYTDAQQHASAD